MQRRDTFKNGAAFGHLSKVGTLQVAINFGFHEFANKNQPSHKTTKIFYGLQIFKFVNNQKSKEVGMDDKIRLGTLLFTCCLSNSSMV